MPRVLVTTSEARTPGSALRRPSQHETLFLRSPLANDAEKGGRGSPGTFAIPAPPTGGLTGAWLGDFGESSTERTYHDPLLGTARRLCISRHRPQPRDHRLNNPILGWRIRIVASRCLRDSSATQAAGAVGPGGPGDKVCEFVFLA